MKILINRNGCLTILWGLQNSLEFLGLHTLFAPFGWIRYKSRDLTFDLIPQYRQYNIHTSNGVVTKKR